MREASDGYTYWESSEYQILQLLPPGNFVAVMFDDDETPWKLRLEPLLFIALAKKTTSYRRVLTRDRENRISGTSRECEDPFEEQVLVGVQFFTDEPMQIVEEFSNCVGIMPSNEDVVRFAKDNLTNEQIKMFQFDSVAT